MPRCCNLSSTNGAMFVSESACAWMGPRSPRWVRCPVCQGHDAPARMRASGAQAARDTSGEVTLVDLAESIDRDKPGVAEIARRLSGLEIRHEEFDYAKPSAKKVRNPVLNADAFYLLPSRLLQNCIKSLGVSNRVEDAIDVASDMLADDEDLRNAPSKWVECVNDSQPRDVFT
jgi:hypothetical protein